MKLKEVWRRVRHAIKDLFAGADGASDGGDHGDEQSPETQAAVATTVGESKTNNPPSAMTAAAPALHFDFGGVNASKAVEDPENQLLSAAMDSTRVAFKFSKSDWWGATHDTPTMRCCIFYKDVKGEWRGGFWEWGSPDRTTRNFTNIRDGYKGWNAAAFFAAAQHLVFICDKSGRKRSNIVYL